jgi:GT2 family glycosyltransferase
MDKVIELVLLIPTIIGKVIRDPSLLKKNLTRKVFNRIFTSRLQMQKYDIVNNITDFRPLEFPVYENPIVSIIIPAYNKWEVSYACFVTLLRNCTGVPYEVIFADDVSTDETKNAEQYLKNVKVLHNKENLRFVKNCNNAAKYAKGKYIVLLNNDTNVQKNWLESIISLFESDPRIGIVGSKLIYPDGRLQEAGGIIWANGVPENYGNLYNPNEYKYNYVREVDYVSGASLAIPRVLWEKLGGMDEDLTPGYFDDSDLAMTVRQSGYRVMYQPQSVLIHYEGTTHGTNTKSGFKSYQVINQEKFIKKWHTVLQEEHLPYGKDLFFAREHSQNKKIVLVIDSRVPLFDQEAGSRSTFNYLQLFVRMGYCVKFVSNSLTKYEPYTTTLQQMGIEVIYRATDNWSAWIKENGKYIDYTYIHRPDIAEIYLKDIKAFTKSKIIYQTHDLHYLREKRRYDVEKKPEFLAASKKWLPKESSICNLVDHVVTFSSFEKGIIESEFGKKEVTAIPLYLYDTIEPPSSFQELTEKKGLLFVGGFGHYPNRDAVIWFVNEILPIIKKNIPNITLTIAGSNPPNEVKALEDTEGVTIRANVSDEELLQLHKDTRILIVPLRYGAGVKGKVIDALAQGIPMVSTDIGIEGIPGIQDIVNPKNTPDEFAKEICNLYDNNSQLTEISKKYVEFAQNNFSFDAAEKTWKKLMPQKTS